MIKRTRLHAAGLAATTLMLAACGSQQPEHAAQDAAAPQAEVQSVADLGPGISPSAAPGVAFNYRYAFVLPDQAIARIQEQHAAACERLGPARCRITGLRYTLVDEGEVAGTLQFKLAPDLARGFGKEGIVAVEKAAGKLVDAEINGDDAGSRIAASQSNSRDIGADIARIEGELASGKLGRAEAATLRARLEELRAQQLQAKQARQADGDLLASTPMTFSYAGDKGFSLGHNPISDAIRAFLASVTAIMTVVLVGLGYVLPWAALAGLLLVLWRTRPVRWLRNWVRPTKV